LTTRLQTVPGLLSSAISCQVNNRLSNEIYSA